jgi:hypothetical protein
MSEAAGFPITGFLGQALCGWGDDAIFCEEPSSHAFALVQRLAALSPRGSLVAVTGDWDDDAQVSYVELDVRGARQRIDFGEPRYALGTSDGDAIARFVDDLNALLASCRFDHRVEVRVAPREARMLLVPTSGGAPPALASPASILGDGRVVIADVESVDDPADYVALLAELARRCPDRGLAHDQASCVARGGGRLLTVRRGDRLLTFELDGRGTIDPRFLAAVDALLADAGSPRRLAHLTSDDQCLNLAVVTPAEREALVASFLITEPG